MTEKIKAITIITHPGVKQYCVGEEGITKIEDHSAEYQDTIHFIYRIYSGDKVVAEIINCPVEVCYD